MPAFAKAPAPVVKSTSVPASVGGVNALDSFMMMPGQDCIYTYNIMPVEYGMRTRLGYREWATGVTGDVRTIIPYESNDSGTTNDRLWAATENGLYDVTLFNTQTPVEDVAFTVQGEEAGYGVKCEFTNDAGSHYLFYADGLNGIYQYTTAVGWERPPSGITDGDWYYLPPGGADPADRIAFPVEDVAFVMVHKLRIWVILEGSSDAWYLPTFAISGELKKFTFGSKMSHGGKLMGLWTWTLDGGDGVDDYMVGISHAGDVIVYRGDDPEITPESVSTGGPWSLVGSWFLGEVPDSRRIAASQGSELYLLSTYGITSLRDLMQGSVADENTKSPSAKVNRFLRQDIQTGKKRHEWAMNVHPADGFLQVVTPEPSNTPYLQYNQSTTTKAWGFWEGVPIISADTWNGEYFMGGVDGVVNIYDGGLDGTTLPTVDEPLGTLGNEVGFRVLTSFQGLENHAAYKLVGFIRTIGVLAGTASINVKAVFDYRVQTFIEAPPTTVVVGDNVWDSAIWDEGIWDYGLAGASVPVGALGMGRAVAIAMRGSCPQRVTLVGWDVMYQSGGLL